MRVKCDSVGFLMGQNQNAISLKSHFKTLVRFSVKIIINRNQVYKLITYFKIMLFLHILYCLFLWLYNFFFRANILKYFNFYHFFFFVGNLYYEMFYNLFRRILICKLHFFMHLLVHHINAILFTRPNLSLFYSRVLYMIANDYSSQLAVD